MENLNELSFERMRLVNEYVLLSKQLNGYLTNARFSFSKAKTLHGVTLTSLAQPDSLDLVASVRVKENADYTILESESKSEEASQRKSGRVSETAEGSNEKKIKAEEGAFRPFGVLEPSAAKEGRKTMISAIKIICEMATVQKSIKRIDDNIRALIDKRRDTENIEEIIGCLKL